MTDNAIIRRDGASAGNVQESLATIDDSGSINIPAGQSYNINGTPVGGGGGDSSSYTAASPTTGNVTAVVTDSINYHVIDVSGMTANRNLVIPAGTQGQVIDVNISVGDDTYALIVIGDTGISINGGSAATEWSRLFLTGENIRLLATSTSNWQVINDGRIPSWGQLLIISSDTTNTAAAYTLPTWDGTTGLGNLGDTSNYQFNIRRSGHYMVSGIYKVANAVSDQKYYQASIYWEGTGGSLIQFATNVSAFSSTNYSCTIPRTQIQADPGDYINMYYRTEEANIGCAAKTCFVIEETFPNY